MTESLPRPDIIENETYLSWDNKKYGPGTYYVAKGTKIIATVSVQNTGERGLVKVAVFDTISNKELASDWNLIKPNTKMTFTLSFIANNEEYAIKIIVYRLPVEGGFWKKYEEYGTWYLKFETKATLNISTSPSGANVYVDGEYKGIT